MRLLHAPCVGRCDTAPVAVVGQNPVPHATAEKVRKLVDEGAVAHPSKANGANHPDFDVVTPGHIEYTAYRKSGGYALAAACASGSRAAADVITLLSDSGLRGLGGAGFPAGRKWTLVSAEPAPRLLAINIDEGEPGTFKDRYYLERDPHRFLEGALIAAWAVGIAEIYIYLRDEYHGCRAILEREIAALKADPQSSAADPYAAWRRRAIAAKSRDDRIDRSRREPRLRLLRGASRTCSGGRRSTQHGDPLLGARSSRRDRSSSARAVTDAGPRSFSVSGQSTSLASTCLPGIL